MSDTDQDFCVEQALDSNPVEPLRELVSELVNGGDGALSGASGQASFSEAQEFLGGRLLDDERLVKLVEDVEESLVAVDQSIDMADIVMGQSTDMAVLRQLNSDLIATRPLLPGGLISASKVDGVASASHFAGAPGGIAHDPWSSVAPQRHGSITSQHICRRVEALGQRLYSARHA